MTDKKKDDQRMNRRKCLKMMSTAGVVGAGALPVNASAEMDITKKVLSGKSVKAIINSARSTKRYRKIRKAVKEEVRFSPETTKAYEIKINGEKTRVALFKKELEGEEVQISVPVTGNNTDEAKAVRKIFQGDEVVRFIEYSFSGEKVVKSSNGIERAANGVPQIKSSTKSGVTTQGKADLTLPSWNCGTCKNTVSIINGLGCTVEEAIACAVITSETGIGPIGCGVGFFIICSIITQYGLTQPQDVCEMAKAC